MNKILISLLIFVACITFQAHAGMKILQPQTLTQWWDISPQQTHTSLASFGTIPWGRNIMGRLSLADPLDACDYIRQKGDDPVGPILVSKRGNCPFYMKAHYAQLAGAKMLIIVDDQYEEVEIKLMVDTGGQGESVHIPSALLTKQGGDKIITYLESTDPTVNNVHMVFDFTLPKGDVVEYHLWLSSSNSQTYRFLRDWQPYRDKLDKVAIAQPHFAHFRASVDTDPNIDNCICGGRYCSTDPDGELSNTGADVVLEDLRQMCIIDKAGVDSWWAYIDNYDETCLEGGTMKDCSTKTMLKSNIDSEEIENCVNKDFDNGSITGCKSNSRLDAEEELINKDGVIIFPSATINGFIYRGNLIPGTGLFEAICESFNTIPSVCSPILSTPDSVVNQPTRNHTPVVISALAFLLFFGLFIFCCYRRYLKREMYKQMVRDVNIAVSQYIAFKDDEMSRDDKDEN